MLNTYPLWKNFAVLLVVVLGITYAMPNIYPVSYTHLTLPTTPYV